MKQCGKIPLAIFDGVIETMMIAGCAVLVVFIGGFTLCDIVYKKIKGKAGQ